jgi:N-methylhydantoinase A
MDKAAKGSRPVWHAGAWCETRVWSRLDLPAGAIIEAPAVLEQPDATIFIDPGLRGRVDHLGNVIVERSP